MSRPESQKIFHFSSFHMILSCPVVGGATSVAVTSITLLLILKGLFGQIKLLSPYLSKT